MRTLLECQAEVFRRSEQRIRKRRQRRKWVLTICVPLVLCLSLLGIFWPGEVPPAVEDSGDNLTNESYFYAARVDVSGKGADATYTDAQEVQAITDFLNTLAGKSIQYSNSGNGTTRGEQESVLADEALSQDVSIDTTAGSGSGYQITVTMASGAATTYLLTGSTLQNLDTHQLYALTAAQLSRLQDLLGIPG